ncbi:Calcineurin [Salix suchowensis]|nr:Calcineurin [Salix suchowensis]
MPLITHTRQRVHLESAARFIETFLSTPPEDVVLAAEELRYAAQAVGKISGLIDVEDVLDVVFKDFCIVTQPELERLKKRFMKLDRCEIIIYSLARHISRCTWLLTWIAFSDGSGSIDREEFLQIPQIATNPLASRMIAIFDEDGGGTVDFQEFVGGLSAFSSRGGREEKLRCEFPSFPSLTAQDQQLQQIVDKTIMEADKDGDGKLSFEEFATMVSNTVSACLFSFVDASSHRPRVA